MRIPRVHEARAGSQFHNSCGDRLLESASDLHCGLFTDPAGFDENAVISRLLCQRTVGR